MAEMALQCPTFHETDAWIFPLVKMLTGRACAIALVRLCIVPRHTDLYVYATGIPERNMHERPSFPGFVTLPTPPGQCFGTAGRYIFVAIDNTYHYIVIHSFNKWKWIGGNRISIEHEKRRVLTKESTSGRKNENK